MARQADLNNVCFDAGPEIVGVLNGVTVLSLPTVGDVRWHGFYRHSKPWGERLLVPGLGTALIRSLMTEACGLEYLLGFLLDGDGIGGTSERNDTNVIVLIPMNA